MTTRPYIIIHNPSLRIVGPFQSLSLAGSWARQWQEASADNPCWNTMEIEGDAIAQLVVNVERPVSAPFVVAGGDTEK